MGCDIHIITEVRKDGKWGYIPDTPEILKGRNYKTFAALAGVRDDFGNQVFKPKGLPEDLSDRKFQFESSRDTLEKVYRENTKIVLIKDDGSIEDGYLKGKEIDSKTYEEIDAGIKSYDEHFCKRYRDLYWAEEKGVRKYFVTDANEYGGHFEQKKYDEIYPTFEEFARDRYQEEWKEDAQDYGSYRVNFDCEDYHTPSYLTLEELENGNYERFVSHKYKMETEFYEAFIAAGGKFPDKFTVVTESLANDFISCIRESLCPVVTIMWRDENDTDDFELFKGIKELKEVAKKYGVQNTDIRIVFAFDN